MIQASLTELNARQQVPVVLIKEHEVSSERESIPPRKYLIEAMA